MPPACVCGIAEKHLSENPNGGRRPVELQGPDLRYRCCRTRRRRATFPTRADKNLRSALLKSALSLPRQAGQQFKIPGLRHD
jgi:hypothetical protein